MRSRASALIASTLLVATLGAQPAAAVPQLLFGMCASIHDGPLAFKELKSIGVRSVRTDVPWTQVEAVAGQYMVPSWVEQTVATAISNQMVPVLILDYGNPLHGGDKPKSAEALKAFAKYTTFVVSHFKGQVIHFEMFNEWETHTGHTTPSSPEDYLAFVKVVYPAIKSANPDAVAMMSGISDLHTKDVHSGWVAKFVELGGLSYVDAISLHPYNQPGDEQTPETSIELVDAIYDVAHSHSQGKPVSIYLTEMGYSSYSGKQGVSLDAQADFLARFMLLAAARPFISGLWWYGLHDAGTDPNDREHHFGLFMPDFSTKPAAKMYSIVSTLLQSSRSVEQKVQGDEYTVILHGANPDRTITWYKNRSAPITYLNSDPSHQRPLIDLKIDAPRAPDRVSVN
jgi:polysaccharide biosynthesis protein PslG